VANYGQVRAEVVQASFIKTFESPDFTLEEKRDDQRMLIQHLKERSLPCPGCLPQGLRDLKGIGCRELVINGKRGSVICFDERTNGIVHLVIFKRSDLKGDFPSRQEPRLAQNGNWASAQWQDGEKVFILMGTTQACRLAALL
jgi:hypothetical protein